MAIEPDTKDWTWVIGKPCPECRFDARAVRRDEVSSIVRRNAAAWQEVLIEPKVRRRPHPQIWSPLEYGCHVRDVMRVFGERARMMLTQTNPMFPNWDQDATALAERYDLQDPVVVARELIAAALDTAAVFGAVEGRQWDRQGRRSNGSVFTVDTLGRYFLHDIEHHLWDVRGATT